MQMRLFEHERVQCNTCDAPPGYYATPKATANPPGVTANICRQCDWRPNCDAENARKHRCMSYSVILDDGMEVGRSDGVSVVFKRLPPNAEVSRAAKADG